jgi:hypothetical protein
MPFDHAVMSFSVFAQAFFEKACVEPKPLRRFITPSLGFLIKLFLKKFAIDTKR